MDLRALRYFVSAVDEGSISGAAAKCFVAQPSITLAIGKLEDQFACQLLSRHRKGVTPTPKGSEFYERAKELLQHAQGLEDYFLQSPKSEIFRLQLHPSVGVDYVERISSLIGFQMPRNDFHIEIVGAEEDCDIRVTAKHQCKKDEHFIPLADERYSLLISSSHYLAHKSSIDVEDLVGEPVIERRYCENRALFDQALDYFGIEPKVSATVDNEEWARSLVAAGVGLTLAPVPDDFDDPRIQIRDLQVGSFSMPKRIIGMAYREALNGKKLDILKGITRS